MFKKLFPEHGDNTYGGHKLALWLFALLLLMKGGISVNSMLNGYLVAAPADGIPLDTYSPAGAQAFVSLFALWGLSHLMICLLGVLVLVRYRSLVPLMYALLLIEHLGRKLLLYFHPIARTGTSHGLIINIALLVLMIIGLALSLWRQKPQTHSP
ncbi:MAG: hypothetical protein ACREVZ_10020 [Burkholderiales bacterium]